MEGIKLKDVKIKGFKSFSSNEGIDITLSDINVLLGANGSGKSNFISFFKMLSALCEGQFQNYIAVSGSPEFFLYYGIKKTKKIDVTLTFDSDMVKDEYYNFEFSYAIPDRLIITRVNRIIYNKDGKVLIDLRKPPYSEYQLNQSSNPVDKFLSDTKIFQFHDTGMDSPLRMLSNIENADYLQSNGANLAAYLFWMKNEAPDYYNRIVSYIKQIMPQFGDFYLEPNAAGYLTLKWKDDTANDYIQLSQQISDGSLRFMALATLLLQPEYRMPGVIILDEPELGLHPAAINQFAEMVKEASQYAQIIIATQSPQLADEFEPSQIIIAERDEEKAATTLGHLDENRLKEWLDEYSISELWNKNVIGGRP